LDRSCGKLTARPATASFWSITRVLINPEVSPRIGWATSRDEAYQQFAAAWRAWLDRTDLKEI
jgi:hypothetical protein